MAQKKFAGSRDFLAVIIFVVCATFFGEALTQYEDLSPRPVLYYYETTLAEVIFNEHGTMVHCRLHELEEPSDAAPIILNSGLKVVYPSFQTMLQLINDCTRLEMPMMNLTDENASTSTISSTDLGSISSWVSSSLWNGIMPGTKWCGFGDIAESFEELGNHIEIDACCRAHDHCPVKLKAFRAHYGLINLSFYTKSHCDCDKDFYSCLKKSRNKAADILGRVYFNFLKMQCIKEFRPFICLENRTDTSGMEECTRWGPDPDNRKFQVTPTLVEY